MNDYERELVFSCRVCGKFYRFLKLKRIHEAHIFGQGAAAFLDADHNGDVLHSVAI